MSMTRLLRGAGSAIAAAVLGCAGAGVRNARTPVPEAGPAAAPTAEGRAPAAAPSPADSAAAVARKAARDSSAAAALVPQGMTAIEAGRDSEAAGRFALALQIQPHLARALGGEALLEARAQRIPAALVLADSATALGDTDQAFIALHGRLLASMGRCREAAAVLLPLVSAYPQWRAPAPELAYCLLRLRRAPEAVAVMQVAVRGEPDAPPLQWALMEAFLATQQLDSALAHAVYLKEHWPENGLWWIETGRVLVLLNRLSEAKLVIQRGFDLRPGLSDSLPRIDHNAWEAVQAVSGTSPR